MTKEAFRNILKNKILVTDGAIGTTLLKQQLSESSCRGTRFTDYPIPLKNNLDILSLTNRPLIEQIHQEYLRAGADIITTNSFNATAIMQKKYGTEPYVKEINFAAASIARVEADKQSAATPETPKFVAGSIGPTDRFSSPSYDRSDSAISFDALKDTYFEQVSALYDGGVDLFLVETIVDASNAVAALSAIAELSEQKNIEPIPVILSITPTTADKLLLSGESIKQFIDKTAPYQPDAVGLNCFYDFPAIEKHLELLSEYTDLPIYLAPSAGLPDNNGNYPLNSQTIFNHITALAVSFRLNIIGGCCGTDPEYISLLTDYLKSH